MDLEKFKQEKMLLENEIIRLLEKFEEFNNCKIDDVDIFPIGESLANGRKLFRCGIKIYS